MARLVRLHVPGMPQHVILPVRTGLGAFRADDDVRFFMETLRGAARAHGFAIHAYALTPAIVHLLGTPHDADSVSRTVQAVGRRYVAWFNRRHGMEGALWDGRYRATVIDPDAFLLSTSVLIEAAAEPGLPQVAAHRDLETAHAVDVPPSGMPGPLIAFAAPPPDARIGPRRSSYPHHAGLAIDPAITDHALYWALGNTPFERHRKYRALAEQPLDPATCAAALNAAHKGWLRGDNAFMQRCERQANRRLTPLKRGRPKKVNDDIAK
ncbi:transposase [Robbsia andropogonis]|uniref:transposase n=1 Tax=Robbsia andropogonis TaxID=28092 RepID=UPI000467D285|nr:transposase [Robbsia andropogonis]MCP1120548.1 transposase [Robbsia andropogonis]MCP1130509.1 transposase [Robbsia andropogonis]